MNPSPDAATPIGLRIRASRITTAGVVLALVYFGREVLIPLTLAIILSLLAAPLVRALRRIGIGRAGSVLVTVVTLVVSLAAIATALGVQVLRIAESLPQYEANVQRKLGALDEMTFGRLRVLTNEVNRVIELQQSPQAAPDQAAFFAQGAWAPRSGPVAARSPAAPSNALQLRKLLASVWRPVQTAGIVLLVLVFVLLEHESLRDRIIRLAGATDIRATTLALNDAGARLSRFFVSQFTVNLAFAAAVWLSLSLLHLPQAMLLGVLAGVLRFVPYVGVGIAALLSTALAFAVDPGWSLAAMTLGVFIVLDIVAGQLLEPHLYGHATGLSPLAVVIGTIFWSALWGPAGLILSTPLTLCLVVAGRHTKSLGALETLLSDGRALTLPQRFYQRALSGDPHEIVADARAFLKKDSLADYCDRVLIPALHLAQLDSDKGATSDDQHARIRRVIVDVVAALSSSLKLPQVRYRGSVLDNVDPGRWLRQQREQVSGRWQGPIGVQPGSIVICAGLGSPADNLAAELLVRLLRIQKIDARHFSPADVDSGLPPGADPNGVSIVYLMSAFPGPERSRVDPLSQQIRQLLPFASIVKVFCPGVTAASTDGNGGGESSVNSLAQAIQICASSQQVHQLRAQATRHQLIQPALLRS